MAIHPQFAEAILEGRKRVEFRKRRPATDIRRVFIYATSPVSAIVGVFDVDTVESGPPTAIWDRYGNEGVIDKDAYDSYFAGTDEAIAIRVLSSIRFESPIPLSALDPRPPAPQSFSYLPTATLAFA